jgi:hypothetical protein
MTPTADIPHDVGLLRALLRIRDGAVTMPGPGIFTEPGRLFPRALLPFLEELFNHGQVRLDAEPEHDVPPRVVITKAGEALLNEFEASTEPNGHSTGSSTVDEPQ